MTDVVQSEARTDMARFLTLRDHLRQQHPGGIDLRPYWRGRSFEQTVGQPTTIRRAKAFEAVLSQMPMVLRQDELLVGAPVGVLADQFPASLSQADYDHYARLDQEMGERSFMTRADHVAIDHARLLHLGLPGIIHETRCACAEATESSKHDFLQSVHFTMMATVRWVRRWAVACRIEARRLALCAQVRTEELIGMANDLDAIARGAPQTFAQALQLVWLVHVVLFIEGRGSIAFGRMDQYLWSYYESALAAGEVDRIRQLLACLWAKMEEPLIPNPIQNICIGGQTASGKDATNGLSYLILEITEAMAVPNGNVSARLHQDSPPAFYRACASVIKTGIGFPALFNDTVLIPGLCRLGIPLADARDYAFVGCIETFLPGKMPPWSDSRVNLPSAVDRALRNGRDGLDGEQRGPTTGTSDTLVDWDSFFDAFRQQMEHLVSEHCAQINARQEDPDPAQFTSPFLSALMRDCIQRGRDLNDGGTCFPDMHGPCGMGLGTTTDALMAIRTMIYDQQALTWTELLEALDADFAGHERLRQRLLRAPKYGNDHPGTDALAAKVVDIFARAVLSQRTADGGRHVPLMAANVANIAAGRELGATPDGRHAGEPVSDAASPTFGRDRNGPTAFLNSTSAVDYAPIVGGSVVNMRFSPTTLAGERGADLLVALIKAYMSQGGVQLQLNVTGRELLEEARRDPDAHRDLVVRVSGFSALYVTLDDAVQCDILARTEH